MIITITELSNGYVLQFDSDEPYYVQDEDSVCINLHHKLNNHFGFQLDED